MWDGLENATTNNHQTPKQKLLGWITSRIPDKPIRNFTTDWNDGTAIGALVDAVAPGTQLSFLAFHLQLVLLSYHPIFLLPYHSLKLVSFLGANRTKSAFVCPWLLRGAI